MTVVRAGVVVFCDVREMIQVVRILTRAINVTDLVFTHQTTRHGVHEPNSAIRYYKRHFRQRSLRTAGHSEFKFLYGLFSRLCAPGLFHLGRTQILYNTYTDRVV